MKKPKHILAHKAGREAYRSGEGVRAVQNNIHGLFIWQRRKGLVIMEGHRTLNAFPY